LISNALSITALENKKANGAPKWCGIGYVS